MTTSPPLRILVVRTQNIGDLVCTTPLISCLRQRFPNARIDALATSYTASVLVNNPDIDHVHAYTKAKHRGDGQTVPGVYWGRLKLLWRLRRQHYDYAIIASTGFLRRPLTLTRWVRPRHIIGFVDAARSDKGAIDHPVPSGKPHPMHLVEEMAALLKPLGIDAPMPPMKVVPAPTTVAALRLKLVQQGLSLSEDIVGIHISARKPRQRWPAKHFAALIRALHSERPRAFLLFWSPGDEDNPHHPGDDRKAAAILAETADLPVFGVATEVLDELIAGLSLVSRVVCSDGGAMHIAAALGKPIVCLFGNSDASVWYPWGISHILLQKPSSNVADISVDEVFAAWHHLSGGIA